MPETIRTAKRVRMISIPQGAFRARVVMISARTLARCFRELRARVIFLAVPVYFQKNLANAIREMWPDGDAGNSHLTIYDYVDTQVGILDNYFRMRSYNYGVHPDQLLNAN